MSETARTVDVVPEDVWAFAREQGVEAYVPSVLEAARRVFPEAEVEIVLDPDPEIDELCHLLVVVRGVKRTVDQALEASDEYHRNLFACVPAPSTCVFRLRVRMAA
jgi:hypothetical protein